MLNVLFYLSYQFRCQWILIANDFYLNVFNTVPGEPQDVRVNAINSTTLHVIWKPPQEKDRNGIIMGYHIHVQETKEEVNTLQNCKFFRKTKFKYPNHRLQKYRAAISSTNHLNSM